MWCHTFICVHPWCLWTLQAQGTPQRSAGVKGFQEGLARPKMLVLRSTSLYSWLPEQLIAAARFWQRASVRLCILSQYTVWLCTSGTATLDRNVSMSLRTSGSAFCTTAQPLISLCGCSVRHLHALLQDPTSLIVSEAEVCWTAASMDIGQRRPADAVP
jgi:hypothetical protein